MAKKTTAEAKPAATLPDDKFLALMLIAADFVRHCGGMEAAKKALQDTGHFISAAGGVSQATKALATLESLREKIGA